MRFVAKIGDRQHTIEVEANGHARRVTLDGREIAVDWRLVGAAHTHLAGTDEAPADQYSLLSGAHSYDAYVRALDGTSGATEGTTYTLEVYIAGRPYTVTVQDARSQALESLAGGLRISGDAAIRAPMPGLVVNILAVEGAAVQRGQTVVVLEAMKMENDLAAPRAGIVKAVHVAKGQTVNENDVLAIVGDPGAPGTTPPDDETDNGIA